MSTPNQMLSMSLDQIIQNRQKDHKSNSSAAKKSTPAVKAAKSNNKKSGGKFIRGDHRNGASNRNDSRPSQDDSRPLKVVTIERPKIVNPTTSVFSRLGNPGTYVVFKNLKRSVEEADVEELCKAIGEVKDLKLVRDFHYNGSARVLFASAKAADECTKKYNGVTLDGQEMTVVLDREASSESAVAPNNNKANTGNARNNRTVHNESTNVRSGLFGTALAEEPDSSHRKVNIKFVDTSNSNKKVDHTRKIEITKKGKGGGGYFSHI